MAFDLPNPAPKLMSVSLLGTSSAQTNALRSLLQSRAGQLLNAETVRADAKRLWQQAEVEDVRVQLDSKGHLRFILRGRPKLRRVFVEPLPGSGAHDDAAAAALRERLGTDPNTSFRPALLHQRLQGLTAELKDDGYWDARGELRWARTDGGIDLCVRVGWGARYQIGTIRFSGVAQVPESELRALLGDGSGKVNVEGGVYRQELAAHDVLELTNHYLDRGMIQARVARPTVEVDRDAHRLNLHFEVTEGPIYRIGKLEVAGQLVTTRAAYQKQFLSKSGEIFSRRKMQGDIQRIRELHKKHRASDLEPVPETKLHDKRRLVDITLRIGN